MNPVEYVNQIDKIVNLTKNKNKVNKYIFIAPWCSTPNDNISRLKHKDKKELMKKYSLELKNYADKKNYSFIEPNEYLEKVVNNNIKKYLVDYIHPNKKQGIELYSEAVLFSSE